MKLAQDGVASKSSITYAKRFKNLIPSQKISFLFWRHCFANR